VADDAVICPFLERNDARCARRFTMEGMAGAFRFCFGHPQDCPVYQTLLAADRAADDGSGQRERHLSAVGR